MRSVRKSPFSDLNQAEKHTDKHYDFDLQHLHKLQLTKKYFTNLKAQFASKTHSYSDQSSSSSLAGSLPPNQAPVIREGDGGTVCLWQRRMQKIQRKPSPQAYSLAINARQKKSRHRPQPLSPTILKVVHENHSKKLRGSYTPK